jgi:hypothetical protein
MHRLRALSRRTAAITVALALCAAAPAAAETIAPPGNAGVDQYLEVVPSAKGPSAPGTRQRALSFAVQRKLQSQGAEGRRLAQIVRNTAPRQQAASTRSRPTKPSKSSKSDSTDNRAAAPHSASSRPVAVPRGDPPLASVVHAIGDGSGSGGMGPVLPALLIVSTVILAALALWRRHSA